MSKSILYKNHCTPMEQVSENGRYYLDSDCGKKLSGSYLYDLGSGTIDSGTITASGVVGTGGDLDFISIVLVEGDDITLSLDNGVTYPIKLEKGECFSSKIKSSSQPKVLITGTSTIKYITGT